MAELDWHVEAVTDLDAIAEFIARDSPTTAASFVARVVGAVARLRAHPRLGRLVPELGDDEHRELIFQNYRIVYRVRGEHVTVLGVLHAAMDLEREAEQRDWDIT